MDDLAKLIGPCGTSFQCGVGEFAERLQEEDAVVGDRRICQRKRLAVLLSCSVVRSIEEDVGVKCVAAVSAHAFRRVSGELHPGGCLPATTPSIPCERLNVWGRAASLSRGRFQPQACHGEAGQGARRIRPRRCRRKNSGWLREATRDAWEAPDFDCTT